MLRINLFVFLLSLFIGICFVYILSPIPEIIIKYPSLNNSNKIIYNDKATCYKLKPKLINCPKN